MHGSVAHLSLAFAIAACTLAACARMQEDAPLPPALADDADGHLAWQGLRACADCAHIETALALQWSGDARRYELAETYHALRGTARFAEEGGWSHRGALILLQGDTGERRAFLLRDDGHLEPRTLDGARHEGSRDLLGPAGVRDGD